MTHEPVRGMLVLIAYAQKTLINAYADVHVASSARGLHFGLSLHRSPFFLLARSEGSGESRHMRRLVRIFVAQKRVKNKNSMSWLSYCKCLFRAESLKLILLELRNKQKRAINQCQCLS